MTTAGRMRLCAWVALSCQLWASGGAAAPRGAQPRGPVQGAPPPAETPPDADPGPDVHAMAFLSLRAPLQGSTGLNLFVTQGELEQARGAFRAYLTARLKIAPLGTAADEATLFLQQAYGAWRHRWGELKLGKINGRFGRLWDYGFYGPLLANYDIKMHPDLGIAAEGSPALTPQVQLSYALQYFPVDGHSFALRNARWFAADNVRRAHHVVARVAPTWRPASGRCLAVGVSGEHFTALRGVAPGGVTRLGADVDGTFGPAQAFVELGRQLGHDASSQGNADVPPLHYVWAGAALSLAPVQLRYHINALAYADRSWDVLHQPGVEWDLSTYLGVLLEAALWRGGAAPGAGQWREQGLYLIANGRF